MLIVFVTMAGVIKMASLITSPYSLHVGNESMHGFKPKCIHI